MKKRRPRRKPSRKTKLMDFIRTESRRAAILRLKGNVHTASFYDKQVDKAASEAERNGWGDSAVMAEEKGRQWGEKQYRKRK